MNRPHHLRQTEPFRWEGIPLLAYKEEGPHFKDVTRQVLFDHGGAEGVQLRYFEIGVGGHSTLERHEHEHSVMIVRGGGRVLVGHEVFVVKANDLVSVPPLTWHQFRADAGDALGFLCLVDGIRDRPVRPNPADLAELRSDPRVAEFICA